jgi:hypothetical protein
MKVYILTMKESAFMKTFKSFDDVLKEIEVINKDVYDGSHWSIFGRGSKQVMVGEEIKWEDAETYDIDSAVLQEVVNNKYKYTTFFIRCVDGNTGQIIDLD